MHTQKNWERNSKEKCVINLWKYNKPTGTSPTNILNIQKISKEINITIEKELSWRMISEQANNCPYR